MIVRLALLLALASLTPAVAQQAGSARFAIKDDDGHPVANHALSAEQVAQVAKLPGLVVVGDEKGDVTLYEFYDLNCPYCRRAAADVDLLMQAERRLRMVLVPYPVLSAQSIEGARVELAVREIVTPQQFMEFHRKVYAGRGVIDGARALAAAQSMGLDARRIVDIANTDRITNTMKTHAQLGGALKLMATPSYVIQGAAIVGHPGYAALRKAVASIRSCKRVVC